VKVREGFSNGRSDGGIIGEESASELPPARGSGERFKLPQRGPGKSPGHPTVFPYFKCSIMHRRFLSKPTQTKKPSQIKVTNYTM